MGGRDGGLVEEKTGRGKEGRRDGGRAGRDGKAARTLYIVHINTCICIEVLTLMLTLASALSFSALALASSASF